MKDSTLVVLVSLSAALTSSADVFQEGFGGIANEGGWTFGDPLERVQPEGGNPGAYLEGWVDSIAPMPRTAWAVQSVFVGDFAQRRITSLGIDLACFSATDTDGRPLSLILIHDNNTPHTFTDDFGAYFVGQQDIPAVGAGWESYAFDVPSQSTTLPDGWSYIRLGADSPDPEWSRIISDVAQVRFFFGHPEMAFMTQLWTVGMDNPTVAWDLPRVARWTNLSVRDGRRISGGLEELRASDDAALVIEARVTGEVAQPHLLNVRLRALADDDPPAARLEVTFESRITDVQGTVWLALRDWQTNRFVSIDTFLVGMTDSVRLTSVPDAQRFIEADGSMELEIREVVFMPFTLGGFHALIDHIEISLR